MFKSLHRFVQVITSDQTTAESGFPTWFFRPSFKTEDAYECFAKSLSSRKEGTVVRWTEEVDERAEEDGADGNAASWAFRGDIDPSTWSLAELDAAWDVDDDGEEGVVDEGEGKVIAVGRFVFTGDFWLDGFHRNWLACCIAS